MSAKEAAVADYKASGDSYAVVAERHGVSRSTVHTWVNPPKKRDRSGGWNWRDEEVKLAGGQWVPNGRGTLVWQPDPEPWTPPTKRVELVACPTCGATLAEPCRTTSGTATRHQDRIVERRCRCGGVRRQGSFFCSQTCQKEARDETYRKREMRTPTRERRRAA